MKTPSRALLCLAALALASSASAVRVLTQDKQFLTGVATPTEVEAGRRNPPAPSAPAPEMGNLPGLTLVRLVFVSAPPSVTPQREFSVELESGRECKALH